MEVSEFNHSFNPPPISVETFQKEIQQVHTSQVRMLVFQALASHKRDDLAKTLSLEFKDKIHFYAKERQKEINRAIKAANAIGFTKEKLDSCPAFAEKRESLTKAAKAYIVLSDYGYDPLKEEEFLQGVCLTEQAFKKCSKFERIFKQQENQCIADKEDYLLNDLFESLNTLYKFERASSEELLVERKGHEQTIKTYLELNKNVREIIREAFKYFSFEEVKNFIERTSPDDPYYLHLFREKSNEIEAMKQSAISENKKLLLEHLYHFQSCQDQLSTDRTYKKFLVKKETSRSMFTNIASFCSFSEIINNKNLTESTKDRFNHYYKILMNPLRNNCKTN